MVPPIKWNFEVNINTPEQAENLIENLNEKEKTMLLDALNKKMWLSENSKNMAEQKETLPELEKENFRVKDTADRKVIDTEIWRMKEHPQWGVREITEGKYKWEQLFNHSAAIRETQKVGKKIPKSFKVYKNIISERYDNNYQLFLKSENTKFVWYRHKSDEKIVRIDYMFRFWCENGSYFNCNVDLCVWGSEKSNRDEHKTWCSVRCIQDQ